MTNIWNSLVEEVGWTPCFSRSFNDWEVESVERVFFYETLREEGV